MEGALEWGSSKSEGSEEEAARKFEEEKEGHRGGKQVWPQCGKWGGGGRGSGASHTGPCSRGEMSGLYLM